MRRTRLVTALAAAALAVGVGVAPAHARPTAPAAPAAAGAVVAAAHAPSVNAWTCAGPFGNQFNFTVTASRGSVPAGTQWLVSTNVVDLHQLKVLSSSPGLTMQPQSKGSVLVTTQAEIPQGSTVQLQPTYFVIKNGYTTVITLAPQSYYGGSEVRQFWTMTSSPCR